MEAEQDPNKKMFKKEKWKVWSTNQNPQIRHCVANPFFSFSSCFSFYFSFYSLFCTGSKYLFRPKWPECPEIARTDRYNSVFEMVWITAIFVSVWAPMRKIPTILVGTIWNSLPWWTSQYIFLTIKGSFGNVVLVMLFKYCRNTRGWKSVVEISVVLFKQRKLLFKYNTTKQALIFCGQFESSMHEINKYKTK